MLLLDVSTELDCTCDLKSSDLLLLSYDRTKGCVLDRTVCPARLVFVESPESGEIGKPSDSLLRWFMAVYGLRPGKV
jgi:hypothetical protein